MFMQNFSIACTQKDVLLVLHAELLIIKAVVGYIICRNSTTNL